MKVNFTSIYSCNRKPIKNTQQENRPTVNTAIAVAKTNNYMSYPIAFSGIIAPNLMTTNILSKLKTLSHLPCIYCDTEMIPRSAYDSLNWLTQPQIGSVQTFMTDFRQNKNKLNAYEKKIAETIIQESQNFPKFSLSQLLGKVSYKKSENLKTLIYKKLTPSEYSKKTIKIIQGFEDCLLPVEKTVFEQIKTHHEKNPEATLQEIMVALRPKHLRILTKEQIKVLNEADLIANELPSESKEVILKTTDLARSAIINKNDGDSFKRKDFLVIMNSLAKDIPEKELAIKILKKAQELPTSSTNVSAFIVKYSGKVAISKNKSAALEYRSDKEIGQSILRSAVSSIEHISPKTNWVSTYNEMNDIENLALAHAHCNEERSHSHLSTHIRKHPEIIENAQKHIDFIIENINNNKLKDCENYPALIKKTLFRESKGLIDLDISALKTSATKELVMA